MQTHVHILVHECVRRIYSWVIPRHREEQGQPPASCPSLRVMVPARQMKVRVWYLYSYTEQLSLPREGSDGKAYSIGAEIRTAKKPGPTPYLSLTPASAVQ